MDLKLINPLYTQEKELQKLAVAFANAKPFKHIVLENFLENDFAETLHNNFPSYNSLTVVRNNINENKREDFDFKKWHPAFTQLRDSMMTKEMSQFVSTITGIDGLITNTDALGQGIHQGGKGSFLDIHTDVNVHVAKKLWRRVNILVYMNKNWKPEYKGELELWDKEMKSCIIKYPPTFNTAVIFLTDSNSPHGYEKINFPDEEYRKSYYAYFYTPIEKKVTYIDTKFLYKPTDSFGKKVATVVKETLKIRIKQTLHLMKVTSLDFQIKNKK